VVQDHAAGDAVLNDYRLRRCHSQFIGTGCCDAVGKPDVHIGVDGMNWGGSLYITSRFAMAIWVFAEKGCKGES